jgi:hypothetical protein
MTAPRQYLPNANNNIGKGIQYNGMINSDRTSKVNLVSYNAEIGIHIKLQKLRKERRSYRS